MFSPHKKLALAFWLIPFLMASTRTPYAATTSHYEEIEVTQEVKESAPEEEGQLYEFTIKNTGHGYIVRPTEVLYRKDGGIRTSMRTLGEVRRFGDGPLIRPGEQFKAQYRETGDYVDWKAHDFYLTAYIGTDPYIEYSGPNTISRYEQTNSYYADGTISGTRDSYDFSYSFAVTLDYDGMEYCFLVDHLDSEGRLLFDAEGDELDVSKASIKSVIGFEYENYHPNYAGFAFGGMLAILLPLLIFFAVGGIAAFVIVLVVIRIRRKRRAER